MDNRYQILVVEDDVGWQEIYREALGDAGYSVEIASSLREALEALDRKFFHVAIVDLKLSEEENNRDGLEVLKKIWVLDETLIIVGSGYADISMFDEFRRMGIFGLTEIPAEARKEFELIDFYMGQVRKDESLNNILGKIKRAVSESQPKSQWSTSPFSILKGMSASVVQQTLRVGPMTELRPFLSSLVQPFFPWLQAKSKATLISDNQEDKKVLAIETLFWSRALGKAMIVRFGRRNSLDKSIDIIPVGSIYQDVEIERNAQPPRKASMHFEGVVYSVSEIDFYQHFDPPPLKRIYNSP